MAPSSQSPPNVPTSQRIPTNSHQPRLRQACDGCTVAKVKCDKGRPACQRCLDNEELCQYSPSRRHGKRARRSQAAIQQTTPSSLSSEFDALPSWPPEAAAEEYITQQSTDVLAWDALNATSLSENIITTFPSESELDISDLLRWSSFEKPDSLSPNDPNSMLFTQVSLLDQNSTVEEGSVNAEAFQGYAVEHSKDETGHALQCEARAFTILRSLLYSPKVCDPGRKEGFPILPSTTATECALQRSSYPVDSIDTVLATNKAALNVLTQLLECRCAESLHVVLLHLTILSKIVFWYNVVVTARYNTEKVDLKPVNIQCGVLNLDDDDYAPLHRAVLCRELQKAGYTVRAFEDRFSSSGISVYAKEMPGVRTIIRAIREDLERCVGEVDKP
jgi:hypothetical protein